VTVGLNMTNVGAGTDINSLVFDYGYYTIKTLSGGGEFLKDSSSYKGIAATSAVYTVSSVEDQASVYLYVCARDPFGGKVRGGK
jgi:hypothetical protein